MPRSVVVFLALCAGCAAGPDGHKPPHDEWALTAIDDLHFIRATLRENHPGPSDPQNPWFREWYEQGFDVAVDLARQATDRAGHHFALRRYVVGFQDGHLGVIGESDQLNPRLSQQWPGFTVGLREDEFVVVEATNSVAVAPGDRLVQCDAQTGQELGLQIVQRFVGLWSVAGAQSKYAPFLFIDEGNPFVQRPRKCEFSRGEQIVALELEWKPIAFEALDEKLEVARQAARPPIGVRHFGNANHWITFSSFNLGDDQVADALRETIQRLESEADAIRNSSIVVIDVRGNTGGSSSYGLAITSALWGAGYVSDVRPRADAVEWRVSAGNARFLRESSLARYIHRFGESDPRTQALAQFVDSFDEAVADEKTFLRRELNRPDRTAEPARPFLGQVFLLTDGFCASACLDFVDVLTRIEGVVHVGRETSADAVFIDNRSVHLPSGEGRFGFSMKVYRGRARGHNETHAPEHVWTGRMDDDAALESWITTLASS